MQAQMAAGNQITSERNHSLQDKYYYSTDLLNCRYEIKSS